MKVRYKPGTKSCRIWEANRKVFLYPENYIDPEFRDNKSPLFEDLEDELLESPVKRLSRMKRLPDNIFSRRKKSIAELRASSYQKNVVMKYMDNLIEWGDQLFDRGTTESISEDDEQSNKTNGEYEAEEIKE